MKFAEPLIEARLIKRYKRFLADVRLLNGKKITVLCPNTGRMTTCLGEGRRVLLSDSKNPARKLLLTLEMIHNGRCWIGVNTGLANKIVEEAILSEKISELTGYAALRREAAYGKSTRFDFLLSEPRKKRSHTRCYVEVKSVTLVRKKVYRFPDAVSLRGQKHLRELMNVVKEGERAVLFFLIQRSDGEYFEPAYDIDPAYARLLVEARSSGVEVLAYRARVLKRGIQIVESVPVEIET